MKYSEIAIHRLLLVLALTFTFYACINDEDNEPDKNDDNEQVWEPYQVRPNTSYQYVYEQKEDGEIVSEGIVNIFVKDPEVEISGTIDDNELFIEENNSADVSKNFQNAIKLTPAIILYNPIWEDAFMNQELEVGAKWKYAFSGVSYNFEVTGTNSYAGYTGYIVEIDYVSESGVHDHFRACINEDIPLALMSQIIYDTDNPTEYYMELMNYTED